MKSLNPSGIANRVKRFITPNKIWLLKYHRIPEGMEIYLPDPTEKLMLDNFVNIYRNRWYGKKRFDFPKWKEYIPKKYIQLMIASNELKLNVNDIQILKHHLSTLQE